MTENEPMQLPGTLVYFAPSYQVCSGNTSTRSLWDFNHTQPVLRCTDFSISLLSLPVWVEGSSNGCVAGALGDTLDPCLELSPRDEWSKIGRGGYSVIYSAYMLGTMASCLASWHY